MKFLEAQDVYKAIRTPTSFTRDETDKPQFKTGDSVKVRNLNPTGHTRLPQYVKGHTGVIDRQHGFFVFPDTMAHGKGDNPQYLYNVRFSVEELFGPGQNNKNQFVYIDMWESYLEKNK
ncbi:SH3-like domain-containing protein [Acetobacter sp. DsW_059]|uniref:SH3-like domain-containing protein n=1 Tax=Acetobacter sp. DsW_059 TaxID=1670661 RepID=UPI000A37C08E|nr:SH3-like domain-containing protein [Acetobacter sp. DsW_059]